MKGFAGSDYEVGEKTLTLYRERKRVRQVDFLELQNYP